MGTLHCHGCQVAHTSHLTKERSETSGHAAVKTAEKAAGMRLIISQVDGSARVFVPCQRCKWLAALICHCLVFSNDALVHFGDLTGCVTRTWTYKLFNWPYTLKLQEDQKLSWQINFKTASLKTGLVSSAADSFLVCQPYWVNLIRLPMMISIRK